MSNIDLKYFGMLAEQTGKASEKLSINGLQSLADVVKYFESTYGIDQSCSYQIAVNKKIMKEALLEDGDEVAFLPPFAGG